MRASVPKPPVLTLISPIDGMSFRAGTPFLLQGSLTDGAGQPLPDARLIWTLDGVPAGSGWTCEVAHDPGIVLVELLAYLDDALFARQQVRITVADRRRKRDCD